MDVVAYGDINDIVVWKREWWWFTIIIKKYYIENLISKY